MNGVILLACAAVSLAEVVSRCAHADLYEAQKYQSSVQRRQDMATLVDECRDVRRAWKDFLLTFKDELDEILAKGRVKTS